MGSIKERYIEQFSKKGFKKSLALALFFLAASLVINFFAGIYASEKASNPVTDLILSNTRALNVNGIFAYGPVLFWLFVIYLCLAHPKRLPFVVKSVALFAIIRSIFITLTHIGPFPNSPIASPGLLRGFNFGADLFFSGHTGLPFLMALIFWQDTRLRHLFIATSVFFGIVVLAGHIHYSIDVLSAFFITYGIFRIAQLLFKEDYDLFSKTSHEPVE